MRPMLLAAGALALAAPASAHVVLSPGQSTPGAYYVGAFRVSHGCAGSPTLALTVSIPAGIVSAKPQPKPGWTVEIAREPLASPVKGEGGRMIRERVKSITWRGRLADDEFDEFRVMAKLPDAAGRLYFPAVQTCEAGEARWTELPGPDKARLANPAPKLDVQPQATDGDAMPGMDMHHH